MSLYFFYQATGTDKWQQALASERENVIRDERPAFTTVLDVDNSFDRDMTLDELCTVKYRGPLYVDFDGASEDMVFVIAQFQTFLNKLTEQNVCLSMVRLYATGGRGFHVEVPMGVLMSKVPPAGVAGLPYIYKELAYMLFVDCLDLRVYSTKRGRMWRTPNIERSNGLYKVQITPDEAMSMTPGLYEELCAAPRDPIPVDPPTFSPKMAMLFSRAVDKVKDVGKARKARKRTGDELKRFNGEWPDTVKAMLSGEIIRDGVGWNRIAMQLALTADGLGKTEEQLLEDAMPLIETYSGDSDRYGTQRKRRLHLIEMFRYLAGSLTYEWSIGGILALCDKSHDAADLRQGDYIYDPEEDDDDGDGDAMPESFDERLSVRLNRFGIFAKVEGEWKRASDLGLGDAHQLVDHEGRSYGYDTIIYVEGKPKGRHVVPAQQFKSKSELNSFSLAWSASVNTSDVQTSQIADILRKRTDKKGAVTYVVHREGLDMIIPPDATSEADAEFIWSSPCGVVTLTGKNYRFSSKMDKGGAYESDLMNAPDLTDTPENRELIHAILNLNQPLNVARILGWFCAAFLTQPIRHVSGGKFPPLQVFGEASAGKSRTISWYNHIHYYLKQPKEMMSIGGTTYPAIVACATSASMPVIFEEMKMQEMSKARKDFLKGLLRSAYDNHDMERGGLSKDNGPKEVIVNKNKLSGPVAFVGEAIEDQSAILDRCVTVPLSAMARRGREKYDALLQRRAPELGKLGKLLATRALALDLGWLRERVFEVHALILSRLPSDRDQGARVAKGMVVPLIGLEWLKGALNEVFDTYFDEQIDSMYEQVLDNVTGMIPTNRPEAAKVLDVMAQLTRHAEPQYKLERGVDYIVSPDGTHTEINVKACYAKYVRYMRSMGMEHLYNGESSFVTGLANYGGTVAKACPDSEIFLSPRQIIYRLSNEYMDKEEVEAWQP